MKLIEPTPTRVKFACECGEPLTFLAVDRIGEQQQITCGQCLRVWEQRVLSDETGRGWVKNLLPLRAEGRIRHRNIRRQITPS